jgi:hypothetical protein
MTQQAIDELERSVRWAHAAVVRAQETLLNTSIGSSAEQSALQTKTDAWERYNTFTQARDLALGGPREGTYGSEELFLISPAL